MIDIMGLGCSPYGEEFLGTEVFKGLLQPLLMKGGHWRCCGGGVLVGKLVRWPGRRVSTRFIRGVLH